VVGLKRLVMLFSQRQNRRGGCFIIEVQARPGSESARTERRHWIVPFTYGDNSMKM
jgi:hypothetical protein